MSAADGPSPHPHHADVAGLLAALDATEVRPELVRGTFEGRFLVLNMRTKDGRPFAPPKRRDPYAARFAMLGKELEPATRPDPRRDLGMHLELHFEVRPEAGARMPAFVLSPRDNTDPLSAPFGQVFTLAGAGADSLFGGEIGERLARLHPISAEGFGRELSIAAPASERPHLEGELALELVRIAVAIDQHLSGEADAAKRRLAAERAERERAEQERAAEEQAERAQAQRERSERERAAGQRERERVERERADREREERERLERERAERTLRERLEREERARAERARAEQAERAERERVERERLEREGAERARLEHEVARQRAERERLERELERERLTRERLEREAARERQEREHLERERAERARREHIEREQAERARVEQETLEREKADLERALRERIELERIERERLERETIDREKATLARLERERLEHERTLRERAESETAERERERAERERVVAQQAPHELAVAAGEREIGQREKEPVEGDASGAAVLGNAEEATVSNESTLVARERAESTGPATLPSPGLWRSVGGVVLSFLGGFVALLAAGFVIGTLRGC